MSPSLRPARTTLAILCIPPAARARSHIPRIFRVPPRAVSMRPITVYTGSAMVTVATYTFDGRGRTEMGRNSVAKTRRS
jgi:hypothetical protein